MKKRLIIGLSLLILATSITACGKASEGHTFTSDITSDKNEETKTKEESTDDNNNATKSNFEEGIFVDVDQIDSPYVDDNLKEEVQTMLEAVVKHDSNYFINIFPEDYATYFEALLTGPNKFRFYEINKEAYIDAEERVSIDIFGQMETGQNIKDFSWILYFKKDTQGIWKLIAID